MATRKERIEALDKSFREYTRKEKERIEATVAFLEQVLDGRTRKAGVNRASTRVVEAVAKKDLAAFLNG